MKNLILLLLAFVLSFNTSKAQESLQNIQDVLNITSIVTGSDVQNQYLDTIVQTKINGTEDLVCAGHKGLFFLRIRATDFEGTINFYLTDAPVLQLCDAVSIDTGDIFVICDCYDAIGIPETSGTVTIEGYKYTPNL